MTTKRANPPRPKAKPAPTNEDIEQEFKESVAAEIDNIVDEREAKLIERENMLGEKADIGTRWKELIQREKAMEALETENATLKSEVQHLNEVRAALLLELDQKNKEYAKLVNNSIRDGGHSYLDCELANAKYPGLSVENMQFIVEVQSEHRRRKEAGATFPLNDEARERLEKHTNWKTYMDEQSARVAEVNRLMSEEAAKPAAKKPAAKKAKK